MTKASDVFSFGLVVSRPCPTKLDNFCSAYTLSEAGELLLLNDNQELAKRGISPEQEILVRHFSYFGPVPEGLLKQIEPIPEGLPKQVDSEGWWCSALKGASKIAEKAVAEQPELRFERWGKELEPEAQDMISGMTNPDPTARPTIDQVLAHRWWQEA